MDPITHSTLGACVGEIILGKKLGKRAMLYGAIVANIPDLDTIPGFFISGDKALWLHRGITHSFFFALVFGLILAWLAKRYYPKITFGCLALLFCVELALHDLLDTCTSYGTGLLEPFSHYRFSFHLLFVVDPAFTLSLIIATFILLFRKNINRINWAAGAMFISVLYVGFAVFCKSRLDNRAALTTPAPFNCLLWYNIIKTGPGYYTGYQSVFDKSAVQYEYHPRNDSLLKQPEPYLKAFSAGYYTISRTDNKLYFNVLRFGQVQGWQTKDAAFALSYPTDAAEKDNMVLQKGRLAGWNAHSIKQYLKRIAGQ
jgi:inner membrane protein